MTKRSERLVTVGEAALRLGLKEATIRRRILERRIAYVKVGRAVRVPIEAIDKIITDGYRFQISR